MHAGGTGSGRWEWRERLGDRHGELYDLWLLIVRESRSVELQLGACEMDDAMTCIEMIELSYELHNVKKEMKPSTGTER